LIEPLDGLFRDGAVGVIDKRETARTPRLTIDWKDHGRRRADAGQVLAEIRFGRGIRQVPDEQTD
jgi:hypothetical protein